MVALAAAVGVLALSAVPALGQNSQGISEPTNFTVDDDGEDCDDAFFSSIQDAVDAAGPGQKIKVCPGAYEEQVTIEGPGKNGIALDSQKPRQAEINAPDTLGEPGDLVTVDDATGVKISDFTISGPLPDSLFCSTELRSGVRIKGGGSATISGNHITEIRSESEDLRGCQNGFAIAVGRQSVGQTGTATIEKNLIDEYQKGGIYADGTGTQVTTKQNDITGNGPDDDIAQNGIQVSRSATGKLSKDSVSDNVYVGSAGPGQASGIILFELSGGLSVTGNNVVENDTNIALYDADDLKITSNKTNEATFYDGLYVDADSTGNSLQGNKASGNEEHDCHDDSEGDGTAGTANTWKKNKGESDTPDGICKEKK